MEWGLGLREPPRLPARSRCSAFLDAVCRPDGKRWTNERVVVFTEYAHTVEWLHRVLTQHGLRRRARRDPRVDPAGGSRVHPRPVHRGPRPTNRSGCCWPPTPPARASTCRTTATAWSTSTSRSTRPGWSSGSAASTGTGRPVNAAGVPLRPGRRPPSTYAADAGLHGPDRPEGRHGRPGPRIGQPGDRRRDPGPLRPRARTTARRRASTPTRSSTGRSPAASSSTPGSPQLEQGYDDVTARDAPGAGEPAPGRRHRAADRPSAAADSELERRPTPTPRCSTVAGRSARRWQATLRGLDTRLQARKCCGPITFDAARRRGPQRPRLRAPRAPDRAEGAAAAAPLAVERRRRR